MTREIFGWHDNVIIAVANLTNQVQSAIYGPILSIVLIFRDGLPSANIDKCRRHFDQKFLRIYISHYKFIILDK